MLYTSKGSRLISGHNINGFTGHENADNYNVLDMPLGRLIHNNNMEFISSGGKNFLRTMRGSTKLFTDGYISNFGIYNYNSATQWVIYKQGISAPFNIKYYKISDGTTGIAGTSSAGNLRYEMYNQGVLSGLYISSDTNVMKISGSVPVLSSIADSPALDYIKYSTMGNCLFGVKGRAIYFTEKTVGDKDFIDNIEDWNWNSSEGVFDNILYISHDEGSGFNSIADNGDAMFFFSDAGVWVLPNPEEATHYWEFSKSNADIGTTSPDTVRYGRYGQSNGVLYLGADKTMRFFNATITRNAGQLPTILGGDSKIISKPFQSLLDAIPDDNLSLCKAEYYNRYYVLKLYDADSNAYNLIIDTAKLFSINNDIQQPYWFISNTMKANDLFVSKTNNKLYGLRTHSTVSGISELFVDDKYVDDYYDGGWTTTAIPWSFYTGWYKFSDKLLELNNGYFSYKTGGNWSINLSINSFTTGEQIPAYDSGIVANLRPQVVLGESMGATEVAQLSQNIEENKKGNYFLFGAYNNNKGEYATIYGIQPIFKTKRVSPVGKR